MTEMGPLLATAPTGQQIRDTAPEGAATGAPPRLEGPASRFGAAAGILDRLGTHPLEQRQRRRAWRKLW